MFNFIIDLFIPIVSIEYVFEHNGYWTGYSKNKLWSYYTIEEGNKNYIVKVLNTRGNYARAAYNY